MMISNVRSRFEKFTGTVEFNEADPAQSFVDVQIEAASISTRDAQRNAHLRSPDFNNADAFPYLTFKSSVSSCMNASIPLSPIRLSILLAQGHAETL